MNNKMKMLLQLINANADLEFLVNQGLAYSQVSSMIAEATKNGWISFDNDSIQVTNIGKEVLNESVNNQYSGNQDKWVSRDERFKTIQIDIDAVYLPTKKESFFL